MAKTALLACMIFTITAPAFSQNKTWLGIEGNIASDQYKEIDAGGYLKSPPLLAALAGVNIRQEIGQTIFVETGLMMKNYDEGIHFKGEPSYGVSTGFVAWIIPLRVGAKFKLTRKLNILPVVGYSYCINNDFDYGAGNGGGITTTSEHRWEYSYISSYQNKTFGLIQSGAAFQFSFFRRAVLNVSGNYYFGLRDVVRQDISYVVDNNPPQTAVMKSKGQFWSVGVSMQYPISNFWTKKSS